MKEAYIKPISEIEKFNQFEVLTTSVNSDPTDDNDQVFGE